MVCVYCDGKTRVTNSRLQKRANSVWRRRECVKCGSVFTSIETIHYGHVWLVNSSQQHLKPFSVQKLQLSIYRSCQHRPNALTDAQGLTDTVIQKMRSSARKGVVDSQAITDIVQVSLNRFDTAASVHYAAHHRI